MAVFSKCHGTGIQDCDWQQLDGKSLYKFSVGGM